MVLREWAQVGIILLLALPAFSINFVCPFFHFWTWKLGNSNHFPSSSSSNLQGFFLQLRAGSLFYLRRKGTENLFIFVVIGKALALEYPFPDKRIRFMGIGRSASAEGI